MGKWQFYVVPVLFSILFLGSFANLQEAFAGVPEFCASGAGGDRTNVVTNNINDEDNARTYATDDPAAEVDLQQGWWVATRFSFSCQVSPMSLGRRRSFARPRCSS